MCVVSCVFIQKGHLLVRGLSVDGERIPVLVLSWGCLGAAVQDWSVYAFAYAVFDVVYGDAMSLLLSRCNTREAPPHCDYKTEEWRSHGVEELISTYPSVVALGLCGCMLIRFSAVWLLPFTLL